MKTVVSLRKVQCIVKASAEKLDVDMPGWHKNIDLDTFNIGSDSRCVAGQLNIATRPNPDHSMKDNKYPRAFANELAYSFHRGFYIPITIDVVNSGGKYPHILLQRLWVHQIKKRKAVDAIYRT
jgi:hypothetical protein